MGLNKSKGNMYPFITHTWNTVKGKCPHDCSYCYMKRWGKQKPIRFDESELKTDLGEGNFIFVGSSCDMWADSIPEDWVLNTIDHIEKYPYNTYLFQSKNPERMFKGRWMFKPTINFMFGTTIETNRYYKEMGKTPIPISRSKFLYFIGNKSFKTMITVEPIMDFDRQDLVDLIIICNPEWVNIGADSQNSGLPEPGADKIKALIETLKAEKIKVKIKDNLKRLMRGK